MKKIIIGPIIYSFFEDFLKTQTGISHRSRACGKYPAGTRGSTRNIIP